MLTEIYIEALLVDEDLADQVWEAWDGGLISDEVAVWAWWCILFNRKVEHSTVAAHQGRSSRVERIIAEHDEPP